MCDSFMPSIFFTGGQLVRGARPVLRVVPGGSRLPGLLLRARQGGHQLEGEDPREESEQHSAVAGEHSHSSKCPWGGGRGLVGSSLIESRQFTGW
jgi:hypothetical protein